MIQGPITGGQHGWAFNRPLIDLAAKGFVRSRAAPKSASPRSALSSEALPRAAPTSQA